MNPKEMMKLKPMMEEFRDRHPRFVEFFSYAGQSITEDSLIEIAITDADGKKIITNMRVAPEDLELFALMRSMLG
ncbi:MAG: hypothetical protein K5695_05860 [Oscillospiraceae bacterium]|nr:hypothetical protein [Oscillospiraceae bacterium]